MVVGTTALPLILLLERGHSGSLATFKAPITNDAEKERRLLLSNADALVRRVKRLFVHHRMGDVSNK